jgi:precorrin-2 dehydrogenase/sirohydrochlorin ferrochelatase
MKSFMPICIDVSEARIVMIGGGNVALQKLRSIIKYAGNVHVFAKNILPEIKDMPVHCAECDYDDSLLGDALLVYACTNDPELNRRVCEHGKTIGALVSGTGVEHPRDFISPAVFRHEEMTVAVSSNGQSIKESVKWRDAIRRFILDESGVSGEKK